MTCTPFPLPRDIEDKLLRLMAQLGLVMGMVDLIVTPHGEYVFLEVNEQGQFLWVEEKNPEIPVFAAFLAFLMDPEGGVGATAPPVTFAEYLKSEAMESFRRTELAKLEEEPPTGFCVEEPA
jgi:hypothetical protein